LLFDKMALRRKKSSYYQGPSYGFLGVAYIMLLVVPISAHSHQPLASHPPQGKTQLVSVSNSLATHQPDRYKQSPEIRAVEANKTKVAIIGEITYTNLKPSVLSTKKTHFIHIYWYIVSNISIGGGIAGIYLADLLDSNDPGLTSTQVTLFEKEPQIGGRIGKAYLYDVRNNSWTKISPTDSGADMFDSDDEAPNDCRRS
jgi:hypothetical protein